jgi:hypothetical protein
VTGIGRLNALFTFVEDDELRHALAKLTRCRFWSPPCNICDLPTLLSMLGVIEGNPAVRIKGEWPHAIGCGDGYRERFERAVDHLSDELARNDAATRDRISIGWERLKTLPLLVCKDTVPDFNKQIQQNHKSPKKMPESDERALVPHRTWRRTSFPSVPISYGLRT